MSERVIKLREGETMRFLELYKEEKLLYDPNLEEYRDRELRNAAASRISDALQIPGFGPREIVSKIRNLRSSYCQELKRIAESEMRGLVYKPKVFWFELMDSFIRPFIQQRWHQSSLHSTHYEDSQAECSESSSIHDAEENDEDLPSSRFSGPKEEDIYVEPLTVKIEPTSTINKRKATNSIAPLKIKRIYTGSRQNTFSNTAENSSHPSDGSREDVYDIFGRYVAEMLRTVGPPNAFRLQETLTSTLINAICEQQALYD